MKTVIIPLILNVLIYSQLLCTTQEDASRPNVVFIMSDDHAAHAISSYGSRINSTPHIDRLASEGMLFENAFCTNSICSPSRAVILTGKYSHLNGVLDNRTQFDGSQQALPKLMQQAGYQTAIVGKWHLKSEPTGFHYSCVLPGQGAYHNPEVIENGRKKQLTGYVTDLITDKALDWIQNRESSDKPFFLMLHHKAPHANWIPDEKHMSLFADENILLPATFNDDHKTRRKQISEHRLHVGPQQWELHFQRRLGDIPEGITGQSAREWVYQKYMTNYLRCIASVDDNVGRVLDFLDQSGLSENTLVFYTSDQGFFLGDHGLYDKRFMYEESLRIPLLVRLPGKIKAQSRSDEIVLNLDFASTILDYAGAPIPDDIQGESMLSILSGVTPRVWRNEMYYRFYEDAYGVGPHEGIRTKRYKLIHFLYGDMGWELYDLKDDPDELRNIYDNTQNIELIEKLKNRLSILRRKYQFPVRSAN